MWKVFTQKSNICTLTKIFYDAFSVLFYYDTGAAFEKKKILQMIIEGKRKKCSLLKNKIQDKNILLQIREEIGRKTWFSNYGVIGQEIKFLVLDKKQDRKN